MRISIHPKLIPTGTLTAPKLSIHPIIAIREKVLPCLFFLLAFNLLFLGFYRNQWEMARPKKFSAFQNDVESYILARMVVTRQSGLLSYGGLPGWGDVDPEHFTDIEDADYVHQYVTYMDRSSFRSYWPKESNPGFHGLFFSILDTISPFPAPINLKLFRALASGLFALTLAGTILWFYLEFGGLAAIFVLFSCLASQWMTLFGRNLFFFSWVFYFPMLALLFRLRAERTGNALSNRGLFALVFALVLFKCLFNGYDFILPALGMVASPIIFYGVLDQNKKKLIERLLIAGLAILLAIFVSLVILSIQNLAASGSLQSGVDFIVQTFVRRTYSLGDPSNNVSIWLILSIYLNEFYLDRHVSPYWAVILLFALASGIYWAIRRSVGNPTGSALVLALWFSLFGPLSWYTVFKSLAYVHTHMNYLPWHMPFTIFGFGLCGFVVQKLIGLVWSAIQKKTTQKRTEFEKRPLKRPGQLRHPIPLILKRNDPSIDWEKVKIIPWAEER